MPDSIETKRRFDSRDFSFIAEYIADELQRRKGERRDRERQWEEIDRQIEMEPDPTVKKDKNGKDIPWKAWMSEVEMPFQAQSLEVLVADARRMMLPASGPWFMSHALLSDEYLGRVDFQSLVAGDENEVPSRINQDNADKLVDGWLAHLHRQYEFHENVNRINAEAFKYGVGVGRARMASKEVFMDTARGVVRKNQKIPVLFPRSIKDTYLDDTAQMAMNEGMVLGPSVIHCWVQKLSDIRLAANKGSTDPDNENGGWMPKMLKGMDGNEKGEVQVIEYEGDMVVPRTSVPSMFIPNVIITVVQGKKSDKTIGVVARLRFRKYPFSSYLMFPYHHEDSYSPYAASPLIKGRPIQIGTTQSFNRFLDNAALRSEPPIGWDSSDVVLAAQGGPNIFPGAKWSSLSDIQVHNDIGDPAAMLQAFIAFKQQYDDVTGVNQPRLGAQTVSHTTAFAKEAELSRGTVRTVDYAQDSLKGPLTTFLYMEYEMSRANMEGDHVFFIDAYKGFVKVRKEFLPDMATFEAFGAGGPAEQQQKLQAKLSSLQTAIQIEVLKIQAGMPPELDLSAIQKQILLEGGWANVDEFIAPAVAGSQGQAGMAGGSQIPSGPATAAIQGIQRR